MSSIKELAHKYSPHQITVTGYFPAGLTKRGERDFRREYHIPPFIKLVDDRKMLMTEKLDARVTPEAFILDKNQKVVYRGAIDNWFYELGRYRLTITENYLIDAIEASLQGKVPAIKRTEAIGCYIQRASNKMEKQHH